MTHWWSLWAYLGGSRALGQVYGFWEFALGYCAYLCYGFGQAVQVADRLVA